MTRVWVRPNPADSDVIKLNTINGLNGYPVIVNYKEYGYEPAFCHISAKHRALEEGGRRIHGWSYWRVTDIDETSGNSASLMIAEHHSVWESHKGELIDVTPPRHGGEATLFLRDDGASIVCSAGEIPIRSNLMDIQAGVFLRDGAEVDYANYVLSEDATVHAQDYAQRIGFDLARYHTEDENG